MRIAAFLEVFQNTAVELKHVVKPLLQQIRRGFFAANAAGTKRHDGFVLQARIGVRRRCGEIAKMIDTEILGVGERAVFDFERVARIEQHYVAPLV